MIGEEWRPIDTGAHSASNLGRIRRDVPGPSTHVGAILSPCADRLGYMNVCIGPPRRRGRVRLVHRLVTQAFLGPCPVGLEVNHKNGDKADNRLENLEYVSKSENMRHAVRHGLVRTPSRARLTPEQVREIRRRGGRGKETSFVLAAEFGVNRSHISRIVRGETWEGVR